MAEQKKRTAWTVQDVISGKSDDTGTMPKFKSGYSGPKKSTSSVMDKYNLPRQGASSATGAIRPQSSFSKQRRGGIVDYAWIAFAGVLLACLIASVSIYSVKSSSREGIYYPTRIPTVGGIVKEIVEEYKQGGLGSNYAKKQSESSVADSTADSTSAGSDELGEASSGNESMLGESTSTASAPNSTTGATMAIDTGSAYGDYKSATSYDELLEQLDKALSANNFSFVGAKLAYQGDSGDLIGYPQSVVEHFTQYMFDNPSKKEAFLAEIKDTDTYMAKNASAFVVKLPLLQFTINMGYDGTTVSVSGFSEQVMDSGQSAVVSPLLPCMYTISVSTSGGSQTSDVECNMNEGNLQVNIGVTN